MFGEIRFHAMDSEDSQSIAKGGWIPIFVRFEPSEHPPTGTSDSRLASR